jgi:transcription-repair coupling factor (superfamily II helicase)
VKAGWLGPVLEDPRVLEIRDGLSEGALVPISGLQGSARSLVPLLATGAPLLVVVPHERDVDAVAGDLACFAREAGDEGLVLTLPAPGPVPFRGLPRHPEASLRRALALHAGLRRRCRVLVASPAGLLRPVLAPSFFETRVFELRAGEEMIPEILLEALDEAGYRREDPVTSPSQVARRGGILDLFPPDRDLPVRIEFLGDTIERLRPFRPDTQRSEGQLESLEILPLSDVLTTRSLTQKLRLLLEERFQKSRDLGVLLAGFERGAQGDLLADLLALVPGATLPAWSYFEGAVPVSFDPELVAEEAELFHARAREHRQKRGEAPLPETDEVLVSSDALRLRLQQPPGLELREVDPQQRGVRLPARPVRRYAGDIRSLEADLRAGNGRSVLFLGNAGRAARLREVLGEAGFPLGEGATAEVRIGALTTGFELDLPLRVLSDGDIFPEEVHVHPRGRPRGIRSFLSDFRDLRVGDLVVHGDHGIGRFEGLETLSVGGLDKEFMVLSYQGGDKLKVPIESFDLVQKYQSSEGARPKIDRLGSGSWEKVTRRVKKAMREMAAELLRLYAERKARPGHPFTAESPWQEEFEESFEFEETQDQAVAIADVAGDMAAPSPMDRLICGDVGYGKTEVAMRAAMRAALDHKQVALLAPTTILAFQHWKTFRKRFAPFPVRVEMVSRLRSPQEIQGVLKALAEGRVDILIGTHRLLSKDVEFRDLGLLVIDEEQRFGVSAKERLKHMKTTIDCLTLSATPIPRTLQMGLSGIRDMSVIETPPKDRLAIQTSIVTFEKETIAAAIRQEISRDGQVYFVHNRVESIHSLAHLVTRLCPEVRVGVAHGQMKERELERVMLNFVEGRIDVLVATTIIENGLDIPRVNTILVNRADRYGLSQLYQLRGRVGRSDRRAYAFLFVPPDTVLSEVAQKRLAAIQEFSDLGAGFRIAALDLELRGAGNLLGGQQSGHIEAVGLDLYVKLLDQTILELKGDAEAEPVRAVFNVRVDLRIPTLYVPEIHQRMSLYKRLSQIRDREEVASLKAETRDRYGPLPEQVENLFAYAELRHRAEALGILQVDHAAQAFHVRFRSAPSLEPLRLVAFVETTRGASVSPQGILKVPWAGEPLRGLEVLLEALEAVSGPGRPPTP